MTLRHLFKGHKISEPNFGDRTKINSTKVTKKSLNRSSEKVVKKKGYKGSSQMNKKSYKGTPQKIIDFSSYLKKTKKNSRNKYSTIHKNEITKSGSGLGSKVKRKKPPCVSKQKESMNKFLDKYKFESNRVVKNLKNEATEKVFNTKLSAKGKISHGVSNSSF